MEKNYVRINNNQHNRTHKQKTWYTVKRNQKAVDTGNNQQWKIADAIATIVDDELFVDDFETEGNLAKVLGMSRPKVRHRTMMMHSYQSKI